MSKTVQYVELTESDDEHDSSSSSPATNPQSPLSPASVTSGSSSSSPKAPKGEGKNFFHRFFNERAESKEQVGGRCYTKRSGICGLCTKNPKRLTSLDNFKPYQDHIEKVHKNDEAVKLFVTTLGQPKFSFPKPANLGSHLTLEEIAPDIKPQPLYGRKHRKQIQLNETVAEILVETLISVNALGNPLFDKAIKIGDPRLKWPHRLLLTRKLVPEMEEKLKKWIMGPLSKATAVTVNTDIWTSKRMHAYIAFYVSFVDESFCLRNFLLGCYRFEGTHTADDIFKVAVEVIVAFELQEKIHFVGTDNGQNIVNAFSDWLPCSFPNDAVESHGQISDDQLEELIARAGELGGSDDNNIVDQINADDLDVCCTVAEEVGVRLRDTYCRLENRSVTVRCVAHTLQLCIKSAMKNAEVLSSVIDYLSGIVSRVKHSAIQTGNLEKAFKATLVSRNETRWNSIFLMCERAVKVDWNNSGLEIDNRLKAAHKPVLQCFVKLMRVFEDAFKLLQTANYPVIGAVIPVIYGLKNHLATCKKDLAFALLKDFIKKLTEEIDIRFACLQSDELYLAATFLDPQYKLRWCRFASEPNQMEETIRKVMSRMISEVPLDGPTNQVAEKDEFIRPGFLSFLDGNVSSGSTGSKTVSLTCEAELQSYINSNWKGDNPLLFYASEEGAKFPRLSVLAKQILCAPATTADVERVFSIAVLT